MGFFSREPKLNKDEKTNEEERAACLRYVKAEIKLMVFRDKEYNLYNTALSKYDTEEMYRAANRLLQATEHILKCRADMKPIPDVALSNYSLWQSLYVDYNAYTEANFRCWKEKYGGHEPNYKYLKICKSRVNLSLRKANKEMKKLNQQLGLSDKTGEMQDEAIAAYDTEKWQPKENESN